MFVNQHFTCLMYTNLDIKKEVLECEIFAVLFSCKDKDI